MAHPIEKIERFFATSAEYLEHEAKAIHKHELIRGEVVAMAGASIEHNAIVASTLSGLDARLEGKDCMVLGSDTKVEIEKANSFYYPDIVVGCGELDMDRKRGILRNPRLIVEVLSPSTQFKDRNMKFLDYRSITSFEEYVLIHQDRPLVEVLTKKTDKEWHHLFYEGLGESIFLHSLHISLPLQKIYQQIEFETKN